MNLSRIIFSLICVIALYSCANYSIYNVNQSKEKQYYSSSGFALIYEDSLYKQKVIDKKINNEDIRVMHSFLKINTPIKIINPINSKIIETKIYRKSSYPKIFNSVISKKIATILELDLNNPYVEIIETKKNKTFIAKKSNIFEEEKNVVEKVPVNEIKMDDLTNKTLEVEKKILKDNSFILVINEFYYEDSANNLKKNNEEVMSSNFFAF